MIKMNYGFGNSGYSRQQQGSGYQQMQTGMGMNGQLQQGMNTFPQQQQQSYYFVSTANMQGPINNMSGMPSGQGSMYNNISSNCQQWNSGMNNGYQQTGMSMNNGYQQTGMSMNNGYQQTGMNINNGYQQAGMSMNNGYQQTGMNVNNGYLQTGMNVNNSGQQAMQQQMSRVYNINPNITSQDLAKGGQVNYDTLDILYGCYIKFLSLNTMCKIITAYLKEGDERNAGRCIEELRRIIGVACQVAASNDRQNFTPVNTAVSATLHCNSFANVQLTIGEDFSDTVKTVGEKDLKDLKELIYPPHRRKECQDKTYHYKITEAAKKLLEENKADLVRICYFSEEDRKDQKYILYRRLDNEKIVAEEFETIEKLKEKEDGYADCTSKNNIKFFDFIYSKLNFTKSYVFIKDGEFDKKLPNITNGDFLKCSSEELSFLDELKKFKEEEKELYDKYHDRFIYAIVKKPLNGKDTGKSVFNEFKKKVKLKGDYNSGLYSELTCYLIDTDFGKLNSKEAEILLVNKETLVIIPKIESFLNNVLGFNGEVAADKTEEVFIGLKQLLDKISDYKNHGKREETEKNNTIANNPYNNIMDKYLLKGEYCLLENLWDKEVKLKNIDKKEISLNISHIKEESVSALCKEMGFTKSSFRYYVDESAKESENRIMVEASEKNCFIICRDLNDILKDVETKKQFVSCLKEIGEMYLRIMEHINVNEEFKELENAEFYKTYNEETFGKYNVQFKGKEIDFLENIQSDDKYIQRKLLTMFTGKGSPDVVYECCFACTDIGKYNEAPLEHRIVTSKRGSRTFYIVYPTIGKELLLSGNAIDELRKTKKGNLAFRELFVSVCRLKRIFNEVYKKSNEPGNLVNASLFKNEELFESIKKNMKDIVSVDDFFKKPLGFQTEDKKISVFMKHSEIRDGNTEDIVNKFLDYRYKKELGEDYKKDEIVGIKDNSKFRYKYGIGAEAEGDVDSLRVISIKGENAECKYCIICKSPEKLLKDTKIDEFFDVLKNIKEIAGDTEGYKSCAENNDAYSVILSKECIDIDKFWNEYAFPCGIRLTKKQVLENMTKGFIESIKKSYSDLKERVVSEEGFVDEVIDGFCESLDFNIYCLDTNELGGDFSVYKTLNGDYIVTTTTNLFMSNDVNDSTIKKYINRKDELDRLDSKSEKYKEVLKKAFGKIGATELRGIKSGSFECFDFDDFLVLFNLLDKKYGKKLGDVIYDDEIRYASYEYIGHNDQELLSIIRRKVDGFFKIYGRGDLPHVYLNVLNVGGGEKKITGEGEFYKDIDWIREKYGCIACQRDGKDCYILYDENWLQDELKKTGAVKFFGRLVEMAKQKIDDCFGEMKLTTSVSEVLKEIEEKGRKYDWNSFWARKVDENHNYWSFYEEKSKGNNQGSNYSSTAVDEQPMQQGQQWGNYQGSNGSSTAVDEQPM